MAEATTIETYKLHAFDLEVNVAIQKKSGEFVKLYNLSMISISPTTKIILNKIKDEFIIGVERKGKKQPDFEKIGNISEVIRREFEAEILFLVNRYFPTADEQLKKTMISYLLLQHVGLGSIDILLKDANIEEIVVNSAKDPVWVYHKKHAWLKTNVFIEKESKIRHYSTMIGRETGKDITLLNPLLDAHTRTGDRVNATLHPISSVGNTMTIRKFAEKPWTISDFINAGTMSAESAAFIWLAMQHELSTLIAGGTGSGKTSTLNVLANFFPPNQRIVSIEDTREITLPKSLHWVPLQTRNPNPEGKGGVSMLDLVVNSLRMRPDRIIVGEIRRKAEAEVLFEAMHTGHSVYATIHANNAEETIQRLTNPPIDIPKMVLPALGLLVVQNRNRRTGKRRNIQLAEIMPNGDAHVFMQLDAREDKHHMIDKPKHIYDTLNLYTGLTVAEIEKDLASKMKVLEWLKMHPQLNVHQIGFIFAKYYTDPQFDTRDIPRYFKEEYKR